MVSADVNDAIEIAERAGLVHRTSDRPGIARRRRGSGFSFLRPNGAPVGASERERIVSMAIPPAWSDVWIAFEHDSHLLATGVDEAGRRQYLYHPEWRIAADRAKFARLAGFGRALARIRQRVERDLVPGGDDQLCAVGIRLIDRALLRPGGPGGPGGPGDSDAVGASTLGPTNIEVRGGNIVLDFVGKSGVDQHFEFRDAGLSRAIARRLDEADDDEPLFSGGDDGTVDARSLNRYLANATGGTWTAKDLRTFGGTVVVEALAAAMPRADERADALVRDAIACAAEALGNTVAVCRSSYVAPVAIEAFEDGRLAACWRRTRRGKWLSRAERATDRLLGET